MSRAYSYVRFSFERQKFGESVRRQLESSARWCAENGVTLDESFRLRDLGVSAFRGRNAKTGALAAFVEAAEKGLIPPGSFLLVEALDRLSRDKVSEALKLFLKILSLGIKIVTTDPVKVHSAESVNDITGILEPLIGFSEANKSSDLKSRRVKDSWERRHATVRAGSKPPTKASLLAGKPLPSRHCPWWLSLNERTAFYDPVPERAEVIRTLFRMRADGCGVNTIQKALNAGKVKPRYSNVWTNTTILTYLRNRAVLGEYQPCVTVEGKEVPSGEPVADYYPAVVDTDLFHRAQRVVVSRGRKQADTGLNLFQGLLFNARDKHPVFVVSTKGKNAPLYQYMISSGHFNGVPGSDPTRVPYAPFEQAFLKWVEELDPRDFLPQAASDLGRQLAETSGRLAEIDHKIASVKERIKLSKSGDEEVFLELLSELSAEKKILVAKRERLESQESTRGADTLGEIRSLWALVSRASGDEATKLRQRIRARIRDLVSAIYVEPTITGRANYYRAKFTLAVEVCFHDHVDPISEGANRARNAEGKRTLSAGFRCFTVDETGEVIPGTDEHWFKWLGDNER